jgi:hypothetical protein
MIAPTMNPPRGYDGIKPLRSHQGEPLHSEPMCPDPGTPCVCCRQPCEAYREPVPEWARDDYTPQARDGAW